MTDTTSSPQGVSPGGASGDPIRRPVFVGPHLARRYARERRFRLLGLASVATAGVILLILLGSIVSKGYSAFWQHEVDLDITFSAEELNPDGGPVERETLLRANYLDMVRDALKREFPDAADDRRERRMLYGLVSPNADLALRNMVLEDPSLIGTTQTVAIKMSDDMDTFAKGFIDRDLPEGDRRVKDREISWHDHLEAEGRVHAAFNVDFFTTGDSREPEEAGIYGALIGSILTLTVTLLVSFPIGVMAAAYLEEFAPKNRFTDLIEVNINNLAAVPSIVFGLLGLAVFLNFFGLPRSAPLAGGLVLALMTLPTIIIASRSALKAVPPSIREAALGLGASRLQVVTHHVLPLAMPGILTGTIIGMAQALGETAPLLMIGMVAFIVDVPQSFTDPATVLPVQVYIWADSPERAFVEKTSAAIMVLLGFLVLMNAVAVLLRKRFERRW
ncbi:MULTISPECIES: phosphate ABC transporter permease PstA [Thalassobaculum]|uniref:Phosphate transport system permease protein PstA n=1 Tax=Thalassobaculum litoreum DSM 18839 TaxID=1123362 RepID=A0A8G2BHM8_9PROT|nr:MULTISPECIES: phosphate ABC transporter permease PstA [Thalassobaculum]SDF74350.1 phosphate transport system permease protein [Thalassobaculum litoreum DSM 18839]